MKKEEINKLFEGLLNKYFDLKMVSLCTSDGFGILHQSRLDDEVELDRVSAITSSLVSLGNASSKQIIGGNLHSTIVETDNGNLLIKKLKLAEKELVLSIVTSKKMLLGEANYLITMCAKNIALM
ncbi:roadblock/LC7 domain-containing protein [Kangiella aquimarina]|uniref:Roadblock/LC7 domain-containing protein n=1 Tax=Kangiella aquimarina TaxID=261965 RepID=A0ABZ0X658_9GAMM|nr:roadblock/LC7 domain-containing protein [Kangiella aquimarina]WQG86053.1 roadblock/LC7 domain-containing protein [Kangiella aquimarina]